MKLLRKITALFLIFALFFTSFLFLPLEAKADDIPTWEEFEANLLNSDYTKEDADSMSVWHIMLTLLISIFGPLNKEPAANNQSSSLGPRGGALGNCAYFISQMVNYPPVRTNEYLADLGSNLGLSLKKPAYAQGLGWQALKPVLRVWKAFRNLAYLAFVVIFLALGFMIMFRTKLDHQTVISFENALPKIIITLLLITFSYAIAGLMIDLIYIFIYLLIGVLTLNGLIIGDSSIPLNKILNENPWTFIFDPNHYNLFIQGPGEAIQNLISGITASWFSQNNAGEAIGFLFKLVFGAVLLIKVFTLFFSLLMAYLGIILSVVFSPITLLFNALPGSQSFSNWIKSLFANIIVFPAVAMLFLLAAILIGPKQDGACGSFYNPWCVNPEIGYFSEAQKEGGQVWLPPMLSLGNEAGVGGDVNAFQGLLAFGAIMFAPSLITQIKKMLKVEPTGFGGAIVGGLLAGPAALGQVASQAWNLQQHITAIQSAKQQKELNEKMVKGFERLSSGG